MDVVGSRGSTCGGDVPSIFEKYIRPRRPSRRPARARAVRMEGGRGGAWEHSRHISRGPSLFTLALCRDAEHFFLCLYVIYSAGERGASWNIFHNHGRTKEILRG